MRGYSDNYDSLCRYTYGNELGVFSQMAPLGLREILVFRFCCFVFCFGVEECFECSDFFSEVGDFVL